MLQLEELKQACMSGNIDTARAIISETHSDVEVKILNSSCVYSLLINELYSLLARFVKPDSVFCMHEALFQGSYLLGPQIGLLILQPDGFITQGCYDAYMTFRLFAFAVLHRSYTWEWYMLSEGKKRMLKYSRCCWTVVSHHTLPQR